MIADELRAKVKVGVRVLVSAQFTHVCSGIVEEIDRLGTGFRIGRLWFGWHELREVLEVIDEDG